MKTVIAHIVIIWLLIINISIVTSLIAKSPADPTHKPFVTTSKFSVTRTTSKQRLATKKAKSVPVDLVTDRRSLLIASKSLAIITVLETLISGEPNVAHAAYGDSSNIALPSYVDFLIEKNKQVDPSTFLYQGADRDVQLQRIATAVSKLQTIPDIVQSKKWSQVQGVITGPLGTLISTMNQIGGTNKEAQRIIIKVKVDLFSIGQYATSKNESACLAATATTLNDVNDFVKVAF
jgi:hypothetical protein